MVDITTTTGNFIAGGYVAHNCFAPNVLHTEREKFHGNVQPRPNIVEEVRKQLEKEKITGKLIHLCFTCDPYPTGHDTSVTREIIQLLKEHGNHVQILTKGDGRRDFDLLDGEDWYGITLDQVGNGRDPLWMARVEALAIAHGRGIRTWVSFEPVTKDKEFFYEMHMIKPVTKDKEFFYEMHMIKPVTDRVKIGKLNYQKSEIDWKDFGERAERLCQALGVDYYIKESLRAEMEKA